MNDVFAEYEREQEGQTRKELAKEQAAWDALTDAQRAKIIATNRAKLDAWGDALEAAVEEDDDDEEEE